MHVKEKNYRLHFWRKGKFVPYVFQLRVLKKHLLVINGIVSSFLRIKKFSMCTNYFRLLLGDTGESLTFLHLFKFNHWNKHLKTDSSESINKPSMKAPNRRPERLENSSTLAGKRYRSSLFFLVRRPLSLVWIDEVTNTWAV